MTKHLIVAAAFAACSFGVSISLPASAADLPLVGFATTPLPTTPCDPSKIVAAPNPGASSKRYYWCPWNKVINGVRYEFQRDTHLKNSGRWRYYTTAFYDCQNDDDLLVIPDLCP